MVSNFYLICLLHKCGLYIWNIIYWRSGHLFPSLFINTSKFKIDNITKHYSIPKKKV
jgi:hypothetical protein